MGAAEGTVVHMGGLAALTDDVEGVVFVRVVDRGGVLVDAVTGVEVDMVRLLAVVGLDPVTV